MSGRRCPGSAVTVVVPGLVAQSEGGIIIVVRHHQAAHRSPNWRTMQAPSVPPAHNACEPGAVSGVSYGITAILMPPISSSLSDDRKKQIIAQFTLRRDDNRKFLPPPTANQFFFSFRNLADRTKTCRSQIFSGTFISNNPLAVMLSRYSAAQCRHRTFPMDFLLNFLLQKVLF